MAFFLFSFKERAHLNELFSGMDILSELGKAVDGGLDALFRVPRLFLLSFASE